MKWFGIQSFRWGRAILWVAIAVALMVSGPAVSPVIASAVAPEPTESGFMVFSNGAIHNYVYNRDKTFSLKATAKTQERFENYVTCSGSLYSISPLMGDIVRLDGNFKEAAHLTIKSRGGITEYLGCDGGRLVFLSDNTVMLVDARLQTRASIVLAPEAHGGITPQVTPVDFDTFEGKGYLLAAMGNIFVFDVAGGMTRETVKVASGDTLSSETLRAQWIDPDQRTLNVLARKRSEVHDGALAPDESRIIDTQTVYTYRLEAMRDKPIATNIYEERQIYKPFSEAFLKYMQEQNDKGVIVDPIPPYRPDGAPEGVIISSLSRLTPCTAKVFFHKKGALFSEPGFAILQSAGALQPFEVFKEDKAGELWFKVDGKIKFMTTDIQEGALTIYPHTLYYLLDEPVMKAAGTRFLAY
ncbi:MAG: hypothetical protein ABIL58_12245 [Pseudomonadota bacterium]